MFWVVYCCNLCFDCYGCGLVFYVAYTCWFVVMRFTCGFCLLRNSVACTFSVGCYLIICVYLFCDLFCGFVRFDCLCFSLFVLCLFVWVYDWGWNYLYCCWLLCAGVWVCFGCLWCWFRVDCWVVFVYYFDWFVLLLIRCLSGVRLCLIWMFYYTVVFCLCVWWFVDYVVCLRLVVWLWLLVWLCFVCFRIVADDL